MFESCCLFPALVESVFLSVSSLLCTCTAQQRMSRSGSSHARKLEGAKFEKSHSDCIALGYKRQRWTRDSSSSTSYPHSNIIARIHRLHLRTHNNMPHASKSYASTQSALNFARRGPPLTLFQAKHSFPGTQTRENVSPSPRQSTMPQSLSAFPARQAAMNSPSATQGLSMRRSSRASQPGVVQCIADTNCSARVYPRPGGGDPSGPHTSYAPTDSRSQASTPFPGFMSTSNFPSNHHDANTTNGEVSQNVGAPISATGESLKGLHLSSSYAPPTLEQTQPTLTPTQYGEWAKEEIKEGRIAWEHKGGITSRRA